MDSCETLTRDATKCNRSMTFVNTENGEIKDCTQYCLDNKKIWIPLIFESLPTKAQFSVTDEKGKKKPLFLPVKQITFDGKYGEYSNSVEKWLNVLIDLENRNVKYTEGDGGQEFNKEQAIQQVNRIIDDRDTERLLITIEFNTIEDEENDTITKIPRNTQFVRFSDDYRLFRPNKMWKLSGNSLYLSIEIRVPELQDEDDAPEADEDGYFG